MAGVITLLVKPHLQRRAAGQLVHIDKFEGWLDGEMIVTSKQPRLDEESRDGLRRRLWQPPQNNPVYPDTSPPVRNSPLRGVQVPQSEDGAVAPDHAGRIGRTDAA